MDAPRKSGLAHGCLEFASRIRLCHGFVCAGERQNSATHLLYANLRCASPQVSFLPLDISDEDSIQDVLAQIDAAIQFGEDADVKVQEFDMPGDDM